MRYKLLLLKLSIFLTAFTLIGSTFIRDTYMARWVVLRGGSLRVEGSTNINEFACEIKDYSKPDTIVVYKKGDKDMLSVSGALNLDVRGFDCGNPVMTADLRKTLKSKEYPYLKIQFLTFNKVPNLSVKEDRLKGMVDIELAGVRKRFEVNYKFYVDDKKAIHFIGDKEISFSDFNLVPPRKLGGMIKANDELNVRFHLGLKALK